MWSKTFWAQALERALKTTSQTAIGLLSTDGLGILEVEWWGVASVAGLAAILSILSSLASAGTGPDTSPSLVATTPRKRVISPDNPPNDPDDA